MANIAWLLRSVTVLSCDGNEYIGTLKDAMVRREQRFSRPHSGPKDDAVYRTKIREWYTLTGGSYIPAAGNGPLEVGQRVKLDGDAHDGEHLAGAFEVRASDGSTITLVNDGGFTVGGRAYPQ